MKGVTLHHNGNDFPWILFLHGWGQNKESLYVVEESIKTFANCVFLDLPGFGENKELSQPMTIEDILHWIKITLEELQISISCIFGHSFGGKIAMYYGARVKNVPLFLCAPSIVPKKRKRRIKKKPSYDYLHAQGFLRSTLVLMVKSFPIYEMKRYPEKVILYIGKEDQEVTYQQMKEASQMIPNGKLLLRKGNHFVYRRKSKEIGELLHELIAQ